MSDLVVDWKEYFDNDCKGEDMWGHYRTPNGSIYLVVDGASNHDGSKTGADVVRLIHERFRQESGNILHSSELRDLMFAINEESSRVNEGAYAALAGVLQRGNNLYAFGVGDVAIIAKKANGKLIQVLPLDLSMEKEEAERRAKSEIGHTVNNIKITEENYTQRIKQYMNHGLSNAVGLGEEFNVNYMYFDAKADTALMVATDGVTDPFMEPQREAGNILKENAEKLYELLSANNTSEAAALAMEDMIWETRVSQRQKIKPDDRTALFLFINQDKGSSKLEKNVNSMSNPQLAAELLNKIEQQKSSSMDVEVSVSTEDLERMSQLTKELVRKLK